MNNKEKMAENNIKLAKFWETEECQEANKCMAMSYLCNTKAKDYVDECNEIWHNAGFKQYNVNQITAKLDRVFDEYHKIMKQMFCAEMNPLLCDDIKVLGEMTDRFKNLDFRDMKNDDTRKSDSYVCLVSNGTSETYCMLDWDESERVWRHMNMTETMWVKRIIPESWKVKQVLRRVNAV